MIRTWTQYAERIEGIMPTNILKKKITKIHHVTYVTHLIYRLQTQPILIS